MWSSGNAGLRTRLSRAGLPCPALPCVGTARWQRGLCRERPPVRTRRLRRRCRSCSRSRAPPRHRGSEISASFPLRAHGAASEQENWGQQVESHPTESRFGRVFSAGSLVLRFVNAASRSPSTKRLGASGVFGMSSDNLVLLGLPAGLGNRR